MDYEKHFKREPENKDAQLRPYAAKDIIMIGKLAERFIPELPNYEGIKVDITRLSYLLTHHLRNSQSFAGWVLVDENDVPVGCIAAHINAGMLTWDKIATDSWLFILPGWRTMKNAGRLMKAYKEWAIASGAVLIIGSCTGGYRREEMDVFMKRMGFKDIGTVYHIRTDETYLTNQLKSLKG